MRCLIENEMPDMCSVVFERRCHGKCLHCIYPPCHKSSQASSQKYKLEDSVLQLLKQLKTTVRGLPPALLHAGRIFKKEHLSFLKKVRSECEDIKIELLDDGSYARLIKEIKKQKLTFDSLNISVDGTEKIHNAQRNCQSAFATAIKGIETAKEVLTKNGTLHIGITVTNINYHNVAEIIDFLLSEYPHISSVGIAPISTERVGIENLEMNSKEFKIFVRQLATSFAKHNTAKQKVFFQIYHIRDLEKLALAIGKTRLSKAFEVFSSSKNNDGIIGMYPGKIKLRLKKLFSFSYYPMSLAPTEGVLIDSDATVRPPLSQIHQIKELRSKKLEHLTISQLGPKTNLKKLHAKTVTHWFNEKNKNYNEGGRYLKKELSFFAELKR